MRKLLILFFTCFFFFQYINIDAQNINFEQYSKGLTLCTWNGLTLTTGFYFAPHMIFTVAHLAPLLPLIKNEFPIYVIDYENHVLKAEIVYFDKSKDILVLKTPGEKGNFFFTEYTNPQLGEEVQVLGFPYGWEGRYKTTIVKHRFTEAIGLDISLDPLHSGSPIINREGKVIGMAKGNSVISGKGLFVYWIYLQITIKKLEKMKNETKRPNSST